MRASILITFAALLWSADCALAQTESIDDIYIEDESIESPYKAKSKVHAFVRSKKGKGGVNRTPEADAAVKYPVTKIVLVFTEITEEEAEEREDANLARWENLFRTYPEFFQHNADYVSVCQCNAAGDTATYKKVQGFYIYYDGPAYTAATPAAEKPTAAAPVADIQPVAKQETKQETNQPESTKKISAPALPVAGQVKQPDPEPVAAKAESRETTPAADDPEDEAAEDNPAPAKSKPAAKTAKAAGKPRRATDPKACRPACFGYGDDDLNTYYADQLSLTKKEKKKAKKTPVNVSLQLNHDGTIKKVMVTGPNKELNQKVQSVTESMGPWNSAVKGGVAIKTQVKYILKMDPSTKSFKATNIISNPKATPKCRCASDDEIFGSAD